MQRGLLARVLSTRINGAALVAAIALIVAAVIVLSIHDSKRPVPPIPRVRALAIASTELHDRCSRQKVDAKRFALEGIHRLHDRPGETAGWSVEYRTKGKPEMTFYVVISDRIGGVEEAWLERS